jgi:hypothetical protein
MSGDRDLASAQPTGFSFIASEFFCSTSNIGKVSNRESSIDDGIASRESLLAEILVQRKSLSQIS